MRRFQPPTDSIDIAAMQDFLDGFFATAMESLHVPGAVFVFVENGRVVLEAGATVSPTSKRRRASIPIPRCFRSRRCRSCSPPRR
jgi:hypothetical protein